MKESTRVLIAVALAIVIGVAIAHDARLVRAADWLAPIGTLWVNAIRMTVVPLIVSLLITGVASANDLRAVGRIGGRTLVVFLALLAGVAMVVMPIFLFVPLHARVAPPPPPADVARGAAPTFASWVTSLLPPNPIAAAASGDLLPLVIFTLLFALAIAKTRSRATLLSFFQAIADAMLVLVRWVVCVAPAGVFALVLPLAAHAGPSIAGAIGLYIAVYSIACVLVIVLLMAAAAIVARIPLRTFARAALPPQLIAFGASSSIAALPANVESAEGLGLRQEVIDFVMPVAASTFKIAAPLSWTVGAYFAGWFYGIHLGFTQLATIAFAALFLAFAVPGIPRGAFITLAPLFVAIGLPAEGVGILLAVDAIPDTFASALNASGHLVATAMVGSRTR